MRNKMNLAKMYQKMELERDPYKRRGLAAAEVTIPGLFIDDELSVNKGSEDYNNASDSMGARGVNNLSAKLLLSMLPPNTPFFKFQIDELELDKEGAGQDENLKSDLEFALAKVERAIMGEIETSKVRDSAYVGLRHLLVTGNILMYIPPEGDIRSFPLNSYVIKRDPAGNVLRIIIKEKVAFETLSEEIQKKILEDEDSPEIRQDKEFDLFTGILWNGESNKWDVRQEVSNKLIEESVGTYLKDEIPYLPLRFSKIDGESYGRGFVEEYMGDLVSLDHLRLSILAGANIAGKAVMMVRPGAATSIKALAKAKSGDFVTGNKEDIEPLQVNKFADFQFVQQTINDIKQSLSRIFLLNESVQRDAERVTAEEIRFMVQELETSLGGVYSILAQEFQLPLVKALMNRMETKGKLPKLPKGIVSPVIVTGIEALGRGNDLNKLNIFVEQAMKVLGPEVVGSMLNVSNLLTRIATSVGIDTEGLIKSEEELAAEREQAAQQQLIQQAAPGAIQEGIKQLGNQEQQPQG